MKCRYVYLVGIAGIAVVTPTTDVFNLGIMLVPMIVVFELSILAGKLIETVRERRELRLRNRNGELRKPGAPGRPRPARR